MVNPSISSPNAFISTQEPESQLGTHDMGRVNLLDVHPESGERHMHPTSWIASMYYVMSRNVIKAGGLVNASPSRKSSVFKASESVDMSDHDGLEK
jgi:hypothetical protein